MTVSIPPYLLAHLAPSRQDGILDHGFTRDQIALDWFNRELAVRGMLDGPLDMGERLTRADLFNLARPLVDGHAGQAEVLRFYWYVLAWGSGPNSRGNIRRITTFQEKTSKDALKALRLAIHRANHETPDYAYQALKVGNMSAVGGLGPSFITKVLYFAGAGRSDHPCLILDTRVAVSLRNQGMPLSPRAVWTAEDYAHYCSLAIEWAKWASDAVDREVGADEVEKALWLGESQARF